MSSRDNLQVTCPCCDTILIVDRVKGTILEERKPIIKESTGDRYQDALIKVKQRPGQAAEKFDRFETEQAERRARLNALFDERLKEHSESGEEIEKINPLEMD